MPKRGKSMWDVIAKTNDHIENLEIAGTNKHRRECFKIAMHITGIYYPNDHKEMRIFIKEYIRQLLGPEICDYLNNKVETEDVEQLFKRLRKYTMGA